MNFNTAVSTLMIFINQCYNSESIPLKIWENFLKILAPFAPFIAEELWQETRMRADKNTDKHGYIRINPCSHPYKSVFKSIHQEKWPEYEAELIQEDKFDLVIQINGKVRDKVLVETNISQKQAEKIALAREKIIKLTTGQKIKKIIFVKNRLINIVIEQLNR